MRFSYLLLILFIANVSIGQKLNRACKAVSEMKYEKALDLFSDILEKNPRNVPALIGYAKSRCELIDKLKQSQIEIEKSINYIKTAESYFTICTPDENELITKELSIFTSYDLSNLKIRLSEVLWNNFYSTIENLDSLSNFSINFSFGDKQINLLSYRVSFLNFKIAESENTINSYKKFLIKFPNSNESTLATNALEVLETSKALAEPSIESIEIIISKYPNSSKIKELEYNLADLYFKSINGNSSSSIIINVKNKLLKLTHSDFKKIIDSCSLYLLKNEYKELVISKDLAKINYFISVNGKNTSIDFTQLRSIKNNLIKSEILSENEINYPLLITLIKDVPFDYTGLSELLTKTSANLKKRCIEGLSDYIKKYIQDNFSISSSIADPITGLIIKNTNIDIQISNESIYDFSKNVESQDSDEIVQELSNKLEIFKSLLSDDFYFKPNDDWSLVSTINANKNGTFKRKFYVYGINNAYESLPDIKLNFPIYLAIKNRYSVSSFSTPKVLVKNNLGYEIVLYGYMSTDATCCPSYEINIQYKLENNTFVPLIANYVNRNYSTISQDNLNDFYKIGLNLLTSE